MKTTIFNKINRIHGMQASILLITLLISIPMKTIAQQEDLTLYAMAYNEMIAETDSKIMNHIVKENALETKVESMEEVFDVENWMMDLSEWEDAFSAEELSEGELELESWMICLAKWENKCDYNTRENNLKDAASGNKMTKPLESEGEDFFDESLTLETWMIELSDWDLIKYDNTTESELELENWMMDLSEWK